MALYAASYRNPLLFSQTLMLFKTQDKVSGKTLHRTRPLLVDPSAGYIRPGPGKAWFATTTSVWRTDELIRRSVRDWRRLMGETGHTGSRTGAMRASHESIYTGTVSIFAAPLVEWILLRYGGPAGGKVLDAFAGGPPRAVVASLMGYSYHGFEVRQEQIDENVQVLRELKLKNAHYYLADGRFLEADVGDFDAALTCPPYYNLEVYSDNPLDISTSGTYEQFRAGIWFCAHSHREKMKPGAFVCIVCGNFRGKTGELIDFRSHVVEDFREAGFVFWQDVVLAKNFASAAKRSTNSWRGLKLVPCHEHLLVFRTPGWK